MEPDPPSDHTDEKTHDTVYGLVVQAQNGGRGNARCDHDEGEPESRVDSENRQSRRGRDRRMPARERIYLNTRMIEHRDVELTNPETARICGPRAFEGQGWTGLDPREHSIRAEAGDQE